MHELTQLIKDDMRPALGVTEPGAIVYAFLYIPLFSKSVTCSSSPGT